MWWYWKGDNPDKDVLNYISKNYKPGTTYADFAKDVGFHILRVSVSEKVEGGL